MREKHDAYAIRHGQESRKFGARFRGFTLRAVKGHPYAKEFLRVEGGDAELNDAIKQHRWRELPDLTLRIRPLCHVAEKMSATPTRMTPDDWQPLRDLGFDDRELLEVGHVVGIFNLLTRLADGFGIQVAPAIEEASRTRVPLRRPIP